jgi:5'-3' exonuclease
MMEVMFAFIERLVNIVRPRKLLYIGIGTAACLP